MKIALTVMPSPAGIPLGGVGSYGHCILVAVDPEIWKVISNFPYCATDEAGDDWMPVINNEAPAAERCRDMAAAHDTTSATRRISRTKGRTVATRLTERREGWWEALAAV